MSVARVLFFGEAREAAGTSADALAGATVGELTAAACARYGDRFTAVLATCNVWVNGDPAAPERALRADDEVAILPPLSGG